MKFLNGNRLLYLYEPLQTALAVKPPLETNKGKCSNRHHKISLSEEFKTFGLTKGNIQNSHIKVFCLCYIV